MQLKWLLIVIMLFSYKLHKIHNDIYNVVTFNLFLLFLFDDGQFPLPSINTNSHASLEAFH